MNSEKEFFKPNTVFLRKFRWIMESNTCIDINKFFDKVEIDYLNEKIKFDVIDDKDGIIFFWLQELNVNKAIPHKIIIKMLDKDGKIICSLEFSNLDVKFHKQIFDYGSSDLLKHQVEIEYKFIKRKNEIDINKDISNIQ